MKIKLYTIIKWWLYLLLFLNLGFTKLAPQIFGMLSYDYSIKWINTISSICLLLLISLFAKHNYSKIVFEKCRIILFLLIAFLCVHIPTSVYRYGNTAINAFLAMQEYVWVLLTFPMMYVMLYDCLKGHKDKFIYTVCLFTTMSCILRGIIAIVHAFTGITIWESLANEYIIPNSMRNGLLRVNPSSLGICIIVFILTEFIVETSLRKKIVYFILILINTLFQFFVNMSRVDELIYFAMIIFAFYWQKNKRKEVIWRTIIVLVGLMFLSSSLFWNFVDSFNGANVETGGSTIARLATIEYHWNNLLTHPITGWGALDLANNVQMNLLRGSAGRYYLEDIGMLAIVFNYGLIGLTLFIALVAIIISRCRFIAQNAILQNNVSELYFARAIVVYFLLFSVAHNSFGSMYAFSLPFLFASVTYKYAILKMGVENK